MIKEATGKAIASQNTESVNDDSVPEAVSASSIATKTREGKKANCRAAHEEPDRAEHDIREQQVSEDVSFGGVRGKGRGGRGRKEGTRTKTKNKSPCQGNFLPSTPRLVQRYSEEGGDVLYPALPRC